VTRLATAAESVGSQREAVELAREAVRQAEARYRNEFVTELVVEEARLGLSMARTGYAQAVFDHFMASLDLDVAAGSLRLPAAKGSASPE
jgi:outer membrane protein TolC